MNKNKKDLLVFSSGFGVLAIIGALQVVQYFPWEIKVEFSKKAEAVKSYKSELTLCNSVQKPHMHSPPSP